ncbi:UDP-glucose 4-epimerase GalE [Azonexus sp. IMCC34839]|uniref:UDP-glucose 4-epimerase GalE n=1 Tax=Azonexus sp. IMCC34839 TaxID=3133695 RepID=UPI0039995167
MNVLLTSRTGYIGYHTGVLLQSGHRVVLYDYQSNSSDEVLEKLAQITGQQTPFIKGDVRDTELLKSMLAAYHIDVVVRFAGLKAVGESVEKPVDYYANNVQGAICLLPAMKSARGQALVFSSSATVYGEPRYLRLDESHPTGATNPYGRSKLHIEEMLSDVATPDPAWRMACLCYFNPVGVHESGLVGENPSGVPNNLMPHIAQVAAGQRAERSVFCDDYPTADGTGVKDYIHVMDLTEGYVAALAFLSQTTGHAINLGAGKGYSVRDMIRAFERASGRQLPYKFFARRAGDVAACYSDSQKASKALNWRAPRALGNMYTSTWRFQQSHRLSITS